MLVLPRWVGWWDVENPHECHPHFEQWHLTWLRFGTAKGVRESGGADEIGSGGTDEIDGGRRE